MKKLLGILAATGITVSTSTVLVSCNSNKTEKVNVKLSEIRKEILSKSNIKDLKDISEVKKRIKSQINQSYWRKYIKNMLNLLLLNFLPPLH